MYCWPLNNDKIHRSLIFIKWPHQFYPITPTESKWTEPFFVLDYPNWIFGGCCMLIFASIWNFVPENTLKLTLLHHCGIVKILHNSKCVPMCPVVLFLKLVTLVMFVFGSHFSCHNNWSFDFASVQHISFRLLNLNTVVLLHLRASYLSFLQISQAWEMGSWTWHYHVCNGLVTRVLWCSLGNKGMMQE